MSTRAAVETHHRMTRRWHRDRHGRVAFLPKTIPYPPTMTFPFPLRGGVMAQLILPLDLTAREAERLCRYITALVAAGGESH